MGYRDTEQTGFGQLLPCAAVRYPRQAIHEEIWRSRGFLASLWCLLSTTEDWPPTTYALNITAD